MTYGKHILIGFDQFLNTLFIGWPDETLSSRCWREEQAGTRAWPRQLVDTLFFWQTGHCRSAYESERKRLQYPPELRNAGG